jgi:hypothetical protein
MPLQVQGIVGPPTGANVSVAGPQTIRLGAGGDQITSGLRGSYYEATRRGQVFNAMNTAAQAVSVGLTTTYTGLMLVNPPGNLLNLEVLGVGLGFSTVPAAQDVFALAAGTVTSNLYAGWTFTATLAANTSLAGSAATLASTAKCVTSMATLSPAPLYFEILGGVSYTSAVNANASVLNVDLGGRYVLLPGSYIFVAITAALTGFFSFTWAEVPQ